MKDFRALDRLVGPLFKVPSEPVPPPSRWRFLALLPAICAPAFTLLIQHFKIPLHDLVRLLPIILVVGLVGLALVIWISWRRTIADHKQRITDGLNCR